MLASVFFSSSIISSVDLRLRVSRVSIVNFRGETVFDAFVAPTLEVVDYRTAQTGLLPAHLSSSNGRILFYMRTCLNIFFIQTLRPNSMWCSNT
jgi:hypothetical protein